MALGNEPLLLGVGLWARDLEPYMAAEPLLSLAKLAVESSRLIEGLSARGSSLLLLCR